MSAPSFAGKIIQLSSESLDSSLKLHNIDLSNGSFTCLSVSFELFAFSSRNQSCHPAVQGCTNVASAWVRRSDPGSKHTKGKLRSYCLLASRHSISRSLAPLKIMAME